MPDTTERLVADLRRYMAGNSGARAIKAVVHEHRLEVTFSSGARAEYQDAGWQEGQPREAAIALLRAAGFDDPDHPDQLNLMLACGRPGHTVEIHLPEGSDS